jgi:hypothetical protein
MWATREMLHVKGSLTHVFSVHVVDEMVHEDLVMVQLFQQTSQPPIIQRVCWGPDRQIEVNR